VRPWCGASGTHVAGRLAWSETQGLGLVEVVLGVDRRGRSRLAGPCDVVAANTRL